MSEEFEEIKTPEEKTEEELKEEELNRVLYELEDYIYQNSLILSDITSKQKEQYQQTVKDQSDLTKAWIELQESEDSDGEGDGNGEGNGNSGALARAQALLQQMNNEQQAPSEGDIKAPDHEIEDHRGPKENPHHGDVAASPPGECQALWDLIGQDKYMQVKKKYAINSDTTVKPANITGSNFSYKLDNGVRRNVPTLSVRVGDRIIRLAYVPEERTVYYA